MKTKRIFSFNHRQDIKIIEDKKRIRHSKCYLGYSSNTVLNIKTRRQTVWHRERFIKMNDRLPEGDRGKRKQRQPLCPPKTSQTIDDFEVERPKAIP